jgi:hypothetical protein
MSWIEVRLAVRDSQADPGVALVQLLEGDHALLLHVPGHGAPCDALVRELIDDFRVELPARARDTRDPVVVAVVELGDLLHSLHEIREFLELRPLVVGGVDRDLDVHGFGDRAHQMSPFL